MKKIEFIAEIGINHNGSLDLAKNHIEKAKEASDVVVCSIFVNALQFNLKEDWEIMLKIKEFYMSQKVFVH